MSKKRPVSARGRGDFLKVDRQEKVAKSRNRESEKAPLMKVGVQVNPDLYYELKKRAATERRKLYELLNEALTRYLSNQGGNRTN